MKQRPEDQGACARNKNVNMDSKKEEKRKQQKQLIKHET